MPVCLLLPLFLESSFSVVCAGGVLPVGALWTFLARCFRHAGFRMPGDDTPNSDDSTEDTAGVSAEVWSELAEFPGAADGSTFEGFVSADDDVAIMNQLQDED
ncbi:hypothetical protein HPB50_013885 [Hyalomma asiaticum]|uniref:Uncharacterized protein n=1 Tax=Hyalomma asiaticum TaxID=266040 RepID=A0ACB7SHK1_HYAAI|nr:hypothetical protein HPB50_013885 [Hyalomma asiaticum]